MESPRHWYSILGELVVKGIEGIIHARCLSEYSSKLRSKDQNIVLQTIVPETAHIREKEIMYCNLEAPWRLHLNIYYANALIERWTFSYSIIKRSKQTDLYRQASVALRSVLSLAYALPSMQQHKHPSYLKWALNEEEDWWGYAVKHKVRIKLLECPAGTLTLDASYTEKLDLVLIPYRLEKSVHGASTPPPIDWQSQSLSNSFETESENSPFSVVGTSLSEDYSDEIADISVNFPEDEIKIPCKKERVSLDDYSMLSSEIMQVLRNFDTILKQVEGESDILPEYYNCLGIYNTKLYSKYNLS